MAGRIRIDAERCKGCGLCVGVCPKACIVISKHSNNMGYFPVRFESGACSGCALCALVCPDVAIEVSRDSDLVAEPGEKRTPALSKERL